MKRVAIVVIAALNQPLYHHYISCYWTELIRYTNTHTPNVDVFLLIENGMDHEPFAHLGDNVIEDDCSDLDALVPRPFRRPGVPSILSKTIHAFDQLGDDYDLFFRTNLSSLIKLPAFIDFVDARNELGYSGAWVWADALRADLAHHGWIGPDRSITDLSELEAYPGNTFVSGSGFFVNAGEAAALVAQRHELRYDIADDVAVGLMLSTHETLANFAVVVEPSTPIDDMMSHIRATPACHIRLQRFPVERAEELWKAQLDDPLWR